MPTYRAPGVYVEEIQSGSRPIAGAATSTAAFIGAARKGPINKATLITSFAEFERRFGRAFPVLRKAQEHYLYYAVRHFFEQGGSRCYVVRVAHYGDPESAGTLAAKPSSVGLPTSGTAVLTVSAIDPGEWGRGLEVGVVNSNTFSLSLLKDIAPNETSAVLQLTDQVRVGSLLWIVDEASGPIDTIKPNGEVTFSAARPLKLAGQPFTAAIGPDIPVYGPRSSYQGTTKAPPANTPNALIVSPLTKLDGTKLRPGDTLTFAIAQALVAVTGVSVTQLSGQSATVVTFADPHLTSAITHAGARVYGRGFSLMVRRKSDQTLLETHENLSLVHTDAVNFVNVRLASDSGASQYVTATTAAGATDTAVLPNIDFTGLQNGDDGFANNTLPDSDFIGSATLRTGLHALDTVTDATILAVPNASQAVAKAAISYCEARQGMFLIIEKPSNATTPIADYRKDLSSKYAAIYDPWLAVNDAVTGTPVFVPPCGAVAGIFALTDVRRGVHKAPAGLDTGKVVVATGLERPVTRGEYDTLYPNGINLILKSRDGIYVWGSRTLSSDAQWQQINVRRLFNFLETSIYNGTQWVTFEPNDATLWKSIERNIAAFLRVQWLDGKLVGATEKEAFFVHCNAQTNPPEVVNAGQVVTEIGVAPSRPAEFVIFRIKQKAGQAAA